MTGDHLPIGLAAPVFAMAPMVTQSERAFRKLVRAHGCTLCYTEMLMADKFAASEEYRRHAFGNGVSEDDHPLVVQFAANDPLVLLHAALHAQSLGADAVDLNLGCPQNKAKLGNYGAWLAADRSNWPLIESMVSLCSSSSDLRIPITCKIRLQSTRENTIEFALLLQQAGCAMLAVHGRQLCNVTERRAGAADLKTIASVRERLRVPVLSNGNVKCASDVLKNIAETRCVGIMVAEQLLRDPALFERAQQRVSHPTSSLITNPVGVIDEYLAYCLNLDSDGAGERFTVWEARNADVVRNHLRSMLVGTVGKEVTAEPDKELLISDPLLRTNAHHLLDWWRLQQSRTVDDIVACYNSRRDTLVTVADALQRTSRRKARGKRQAVIADAAFSEKENGSRHFAELDYKPCSRYSQVLQAFWNFLLRNLARIDTEAGLSGLGLMHQFCRSRRSA